MTTPDSAMGDPPEKSTAGRVATAQARRKKVELAKEAQVSSAKAEALAQRYAEGQLALWSEAERGMPNELVRCAVFSAKNRKEPRVSYPSATPLVLQLIGGGEIRYTGEELRQDDETVWMQLVHMAKENRAESITFTPYSLLKAINWPIKGDSYKRLLTSLRRLRANSLEVYSSRFDRGVSTSLIGEFEYSEKGESPWRVHVFSNENKLFLLFDKLYSRVEWETRLALPEGVATWLHSFLSSHKQPFPHKVETLALGAGMLLEAPEDLELSPSELQAKRKKRLREARRTLTKALESLKSIGFLADFQVSRKGLVTVRRAGDNSPIL